MTDDFKLILAVAAAAGAMYGLVTRPLMALLKAEMAALRAEMATMKSDLRLEMKDMQSNIKTEITAVEKRLNERIDAWVIRR